MVEIGDYVEASSRSVFKFGTNAICNGTNRIDGAVIRDITRGIGGIHGQGKLVAMVSSGAVAEGMRQFSLDARPGDDYELGQILSSLGYLDLALSYREGFRSMGLDSVYVQATKNDFRIAARRRNILRNVERLSGLDVVTVWNENDFMTPEEFRNLRGRNGDFPDNDPLAKDLAITLGADLLICVSEWDGAMNGAGSSTKYEAIQEAKSKGIVTDIFSMADFRAFSEKFYKQPA